MRLLLSPTPYQPCLRGGGCCVSKEKDHVLAAAGVAADESVWAASATTANTNTDFSEKPGQGMVVCTSAYVCRCKEDFFFFLVYTYVMRVRDGMNSVLSSLT